MILFSGVLPEKFKEALFNLPKESNDGLQLCLTNKICFQCLDSNLERGHLNSNSCRHFHTSWQDGKLYKASYLCRTCSVDYEGTQFKIHHSICQHGLAKLKNKGLQNKTDTFATQSFKGKKPNSRALKKPFKKQQNITRSNHVEASQTDPVEEEDNDV